MTAAYVPVKGDRARQASWLRTEYIDVDYVGRSVVVGIDEAEREQTHALDRVWIKVETTTPLPEQWINVYSNTSIGHDDRAEANRAANYERIVCLHIWTDADGKDRIERVAQ